MDRVIVFATAMPCVMFKFSLTVKVCNEHSCSCKQYNRNECAIRWLGLYNYCVCLNDGYPGNQQEPDQQQKQENKGTGQRRSPPQQIQGTPQQQTTPEASPASTTPAFTSSIRPPATNSFNTGFSHGKNGKIL